MARRITYSKHIFVTLTYSRETSKDICWQQTNRYFNRYVQKIRRIKRGIQRDTLYPDLAYLRVIERHKDGYPHIHVIFQAQRRLFDIYNARYLDSITHKRIKDRWPHGFSDIRPGDKDSIFYALKYLTKNTTRKTIFKKILPKDGSELTSGNPRVKDSCISHVPSPLAGSKPITSRAEKTLPSTHYEIASSVKGESTKIKLASWSRNFDFTYFRKTVPTRLDALWTPLHSPQ